jgi:hypothetical protein
MVNVRSINARVKKGIGRIIRKTRKVGGPVSNKKGWDALYSLTESL